MIVTITREDVLRYAKTSKDEALIHIDDFTAKQAGFERPLVHGMYIMGLAQSIYLSKNESKWIVQYSMRFHQPLLVDEEVRFQFDEVENIIHVSVLSKNNQAIAIGHFEVKEWS